MSADEHVTAQCPNEVMDRTGTGRCPLDADHEGPHLYDPAACLARGSGPVTVASCRTCKLPKATKCPDCGEPYDRSSPMPCNAPDETYNMAEDVRDASRVTAARSSSPERHYACTAGIVGCTNLAASHGPCVTCASVLAAAELTLLREVAKAARKARRSIEVNGNRDQNTIAMGVALDALDAAAPFTGPDTTGEKR
jgi:hypothetical protein